MLKKIALTVSAIAATAAVSFAGPGTSSFQDISTIDGINFKTSAKVVVGYKNDGITGPQKYVIAAKHESGDIIYATSNLSTAIYKLINSDYMGHSLTTYFTATEVSSLNAGETVFTNAAAGYAPM
ncbi:hypothetical protein E4633_08120 [Geomonas terrae]|uniref:Uncharacterized protein n=1 Tax=Geomonas terrae TaxID=2562681 RepID=A0A4S1CFJ2_9BACT|nr:hypothetical protein [Geomonas terrae]TGU72269.1 hypothetical protein E4633_08120 [Geomonas terrae]